MEAILFIIAVIVVVMVYKRKKAENLDFETIGRRVDKYYCIFRDNGEQLGIHMVSVCSNRFEYASGSLAGSLGTGEFLSVMAKNGTNDSLARQLGMEVCVLQGETYYKFVLKQKFSKIEKTAILEHICNSDRLEIKRNVISFDRKSPFIACKL